MAAYEYKYGATIAALALLPTLGIKASPRPGYRSFAASIDLGDATLQGQGYPIITWHWAFVTIAERAVFVTPLAGKLSGAAAVRTRLNDGTWANFEAVQKLPTGEEDLQSGKILNFDIVFTHCVLIP